MMEIFNIFSGFKLCRLMRLRGFILRLALCFGGLWFGLSLFVCLLCNLLQRINEWLWQGLKNQPDQRKVMRLMHLQEKHVRGSPDTCKSPSCVRGNRELRFNEAAAASGVPEDADGPVRSTASKGWSF